MTVTEVSGLSASAATGTSTAGGYNLTISGQHFDATDAPVRVEIDHVECTNVTLHSTTEITCITPADPGAPLHTGMFQANLYIQVFSGKPLHTGML